MYNIIGNRNRNEKNISNLLLVSSPCSINALVCMTVFIKPSFPLQSSSAWQSSTREVRLSFTIIRNTFWYI